MIAILTFVRSPRFAPDRAVATPSWAVPSRDGDGGKWNAKPRSLRRLEAAFSGAALALILAWAAALLAAIA